MGCHHCPWDSPGKNTGVGCHFLLQGIFPNQGSNPVSSIADGFFTIWAARETLVKLKVAQSCVTLWPQGIYSPWNSPGQNPGVGSLSLLQVIFPTQGLNPGLPHCRGFFTSWATREAQSSLKLSPIFFTLLPLFCSSAVTSTILSSCSLIPSSAPVILLLVPSWVFLAEVTVTHLFAYS